MFKGVIYSSIPLEPFHLVNMTHPDRDFRLFILANLFILLGVINYCKFTE